MPPRPTISCHACSELMRTTDIAAHEEPRNLQELLARLCTAGCDRESVSMESLFEAVGRRSFGPVLLLCGLIVVSPLSGIPGLPSLVAMLVFLIASQLLVNRSHIWLPGFIMQRRLEKAKVAQVITFLLPPARWIDRLVHPRLQLLTGPVPARVVAVWSILIALGMPPTEIIPFGNTAFGFALALFGLALIARDGLLMLLAMTACTATLMLLVRLF